MYKETKKYCERERRKTLVTLWLANVTMSPTTMSPKCHPSSKGLNIYDSFFPRNISDYTIQTCGTCECGFVLHVRIVLIGTNGLFLIDGEGGEIINIYILFLDIYWSTHRPNTFYIQNKTNQIGFKWSFTELLFK